MTPDDFVEARWRSLLYRHPVPCKLNILQLKKEFGVHWGLARRLIESRPKLDVSETVIVYRDCLCLCQTRIPYLVINPT